MKHFITFVGLDVHKDTIDIAIAESGENKEVRHNGKIDGISRHWIKPSGSSGVRARKFTLSMKPVPADINMFQKMATLSASERRQRSMFTN